jgi:hypothetical protein
MTARVLFRCDNAPVPRSLRQAGWDEERALLSDGPDANLRLGGISEIRDVLQQLVGRAADLVRIAAYAYIADRSVSRGGETDVFGKKWRRTLALCISVSEPDFWSQEAIQAALRHLLHRATDDQWLFDFSGGAPTPPISMFSDPESRSIIAGSPNCIVLFSGGADSLCATVETIKKGARPLLLSHSPSPRHDGRQQLLIDQVRKRLPGWSFPRMRFPIHLVGTRAPDSTQRSRPFLFSSLGAAVAHQLGGIEVLLADNGVVSLNPPINGSVRGAYASRSTHPQMIARFNDLVAKAWFRWRGSDLTVGGR